MIRTATCGQLRVDNLEESRKLAGWVDTRRDHGGIVFVDLRDRYGVTQVVFNPERLPAGSFREVARLRAEDVIEVTGVVSPRPGGTENPRLETGRVELLADACRVLNRCADLPFEISGGGEPAEPVRLRNRYLDLRRPRVQGNFLRRHRVTSAIRSCLDEQGFLDIETPLLGRSTPEGARDFLVPSRLEPGRFYALPQSPQIYKQLLMVAGFDRYYQVVKCLRDEDLRADRQPEFTQVDIEASFCEPSDIRTLVEGMLVRVFAAAGLEAPGIPFPRLPWREAMDLYGTDKPDPRFGMAIFDATESFRETGFKVFRQAVEQGQRIRGFFCPGRQVSNTRLKEYESRAREMGAGGLVWARFEAGEIHSPVARFIGPDQLQAIRAEHGPGDGCLFLVAGAAHEASGILGRLRLALAESEKIDPGPGFACLWVEEFPLFERDEEENRLVSVHHPFTSPRECDLPLLDGNPLAARSQAYDLVINGMEIGGGSIRIHRREVQEKVFGCLGIPREKYLAEFGFLLEALDFGAPPHGGIALGLDRLVAMLCGQDSIREVIAFPKTQKGSCLMMKAPGEVSPAQLAELGLSLAGGDGDRDPGRG